MSHAIEVTNMLRIMQASAYKAMMVLIDGRPTLGPAMQKEAVVENHVRALRGRTLHYKSFSRFSAEKG